MHQAGGGSSVLRKVARLIYVQARCAPGHWCCCSAAGADVGIAYVTHLAQQRAAEQDVGAAAGIDVAGDVVVRRVVHKHIVHAVKEAVEVAHLRALLTQSSSQAGEL